MNTRNETNASSEAISHGPAEITPETIAEIYAEAHRLRAEAVHDAVVAAWRALHRAIAALGHRLARPFSGETHGHA